MKRRRGFTLIEILVTMSIITLVASMATYAVLAASRKARIKQATTELQILSAAALQLAWDTGRWPNQAVRTTPGSTEIWDIAPASVGLMAPHAAFINWKGPYYEGSLRDPWGNPYFFDPDYMVKGVNRVVVGSFGPNGVGRNLYDSDDIYVLLDD